jgi:hypothetical protein
MSLIDKGQNAGDREQRAKEAGGQANEGLNADEARFVATYTL